MNAMLVRTGVNGYTEDRTNLLGAVIVGAGELPACPDCDDNGYVMSYDGAGSYVCLADHALKVFVSPPAPEIRGPLAIPTGASPCGQSGRASAARSGPTSQ